MKKSKRLQSVISAAVFSLISALTVVTASAADYKGDVDMNGEITINDVVTVQKYLVKSGTLSDEQTIYADMNDDGKINVFDLVLLRRTVLGEKEKVEIVYPDPTEELTEFTDPTEAPTTETMPETTVTTPVETDPTEVSTEMSTEATDPTEVSTEVSTEATDPTEASTEAITSVSEVTTSISKVTTEPTTTVSEVTTTISDVTTVSTEISTSVSGEITKITTSFDKSSIADETVNRAAIIASFNTYAIDFQNQMQIVANAGTGTLVPEITGNGTYTTRYVLAENVNISNINQLGLCLFGNNSSKILNTTNYTDLNISLDSVIIDGEKVELVNNDSITNGMANANANNSNAGAIVYLVDYYGESILPADTTISQYIEITFTVSGLDETNTQAD